MTSYSSAPSTWRRKLSAGALSVILGTALMTGGATAHAQNGPQDPPPGPLPGSSNSVGSPNQQVPIPKSGSAERGFGGMHAWYNSLLGNNVNDRGYDPNSARLVGLVIANAPLMLSSVALNPVFLIEDQLEAQGLYGWIVPPR